MLQPPSIILQALSLSDLFSWIYLSPPLYNHKEFQFSSIQLLSRVQFFVIPWTAACQDSCPSPTAGACANSYLSIWWCHPAISSSVIPFSCLQSFPASGSFQMSYLFTSGGQSIGVSASNEYSGLNSFRMDSLDLFAVQGTLKSLLQHHSPEASILQCLAFFMVQLSHPYLNTGKIRPLFAKWCLCFLIHCLGCCCCC